MTKPFIPPLPSARPAAASASASASAAPSDKENIVVEGNTITGNTTGTSTSSSSSSNTSYTAATSASPSASAAANSRRLGGKKEGDSAIVGTPARTSRNDKAAAASSAVSAGGASAAGGGNGGAAPTPGGRILRFGETVDSLFCLTDRTTDLHRRLCHDIVNGTLADDARSWRTVVEVASVHAAGAGDAGGGGGGRTSPSVGKSMCAFLNFLGYSRSTLS